jgi:hypothetical protein
MWENEFYKHPAPLALRTDNIDSNDLLFAHFQSIEDHPQFIFTTFLWAFYTIFMSSVLA